MTNSNPIPQRDYETRLLLTQMTSLHSKINIVKRETSSVFGVESCVLIKRIEGKSISNNKKTYVGRDLFLRWALKERKKFNKLWQP